MRAATAAFGLVSIVSVILGLATGAGAQTPTGRSGLRISELTYARTDGAVVTRPVAIWYPTATAPGYVKYPYVWGRGTANAPVLAGPWPLIVHSHGLYECGLASSYLNEALANAGYIVAAIDHDDAANCLTSGGTRPRAAFNLLLDPADNFPFRTADISALLGFMVSSPDWGPLVDETRIGATGHSLGGWTIGANHDPRIQARLLWAPSHRLGASFYAAIEGPLAYLFGEYESGFFSDTWRTWAYDNSQMPKYLGYVDQGNHYSFTDKECQSSWLGTTTACRGAAVPAAIYAKSQAFLDWYVKRTPGTGTLLSSTTSRFLLWVEQR
jgi:dienelactone hydrolase